MSLSVPVGHCLTRPVHRGMLLDNRKQRDKYVAVSLHIVLVLPTGHALTAVTYCQQMQGRMIQLEAAITAIQEAKRSTSGSPPSGPVADDADELARTFGTLDIGERPTFLGPNAISNVSLGYPVYVAPS